MKVNYREITPDKRIAMIAAMELKGYGSCFVGIGIPSDTACLAKDTIEPNINLIYESGAIGAMPKTKSYSTGSPSIAHGSDMITDSFSVFSDLQAGRIDVGLLSAAQIDIYGNLNSTVIGDYRTPKVRMVGSGGAHDIACLIPNLIILMPHDSRRFVEKVDFITSPGSGSAFDKLRKKYQLGRGPSILITDKAKFVMSPSGWKLDSVLNDFTYEEAVEGIPWKLTENNNKIKIDQNILDKVDSISGL